MQAMPQYQKATPDGRRAAFQKWSNLALAATGPDSGFPPDQRQQLIQKIQGQYQQFDDAAKPGLLEKGANLVGGLAALPAVAGGVVGEDLQAPFTGEHPLADTFGRNVASEAAQANQGGLVGTALHDVGVLTGQIQAGGVTPAERQDDLNTTFDYLKQHVEAGKPVTADFVKEWGQMVHQYAASANNEPIANYTGLDRDPLNAENAALIQQYSKTLDPIYLNTLKERMTTPEAILEAQRQQGGSLVGTLPNWAQQQVQGALSPTNIAATVATLPLGGEGGEALQEARAFGTAGDVARAAGRELLKPAAQGAGIFAASNAAQTALDPNATPKDFASSILSGLVTGAAVGGGVHALGMKFGELNPVEKNAVLNKLSLSSAQWAKMDVNAQESALKDAVGNVLGQKANEGIDPRAAEYQELFGKSPQAMQERADMLNRMDALAAQNGAPQAAQTLTGPVVGGVGVPTGIPLQPDQARSISHLLDVKPSSPLELEPLPAAKVVGGGPQPRVDNAVDVQNAIKAIGGNADLTAAEKSDLIETAKESLAQAKDDFLKIMKGKLENAPAFPRQGQGLATATLDNGETPGPLANVAPITPRDPNSPLQAAPTLAPNKVLAEKEGSGQSVKDSKISQPPINPKAEQQAQQATAQGEQAGQPAPVVPASQSEPVNAPEKSGTLANASLKRVAPGSAPLASKTLALGPAQDIGAGMTNLKAPELMTPKQIQADAIQTDREGNPITSPHRVITAPSVNKGLDAIGVPEVQRTPERLNSAGQVSPRADEPWIGEYQRLRKQGGGLTYPEVAHAKLVEDAVKSGRPASIAAVDKYGLADKLPEGYTKQGDNYVYESPYRKVAESAGIKFDKDGKMIPRSPNSALSQQLKGLGEQVDQRVAHLNDPRNFPENKVVPFPQPKPEETQNVSVGGGRDATKTAIEDIERIPNNVLREIGRVEPGKFQGANEKYIMASLPDEVSLGKISNPILFSEPLRRFTNTQKGAIVKLLKRGDLSITDTGSDYILRKTKPDQPPTGEPSNATNQDPNIGRKFNSPYGPQVVGAVTESPSGKMYHVFTEGTGVERRYGSNIDEVIKRQEHELTPEYAQEQKEQAETNQLRADRDARQAAAQQKQLNEIAEFTKGESPMSAGRKRDTLLKSVSSEGQVITRKNLIEREVANGDAIVTENGERRLTDKSGAFRDESTLTKAGMDYAQYLIDKRDQPSTPQSNATNQIIQPGSNEGQLPRVPPRPNLPENGGQVREGQGPQANGGGGAPAETTPPRPNEGVRPQPPPAPDALTLLNKGSAKVSVPDEASHVQVTFPTGLKKVLTAEQFKKNVADGIYRGVGVKDVTPGKMVGSTFKSVDGDITAKPGAGAFVLNPKDAAAAVYKYVKDKAQWAAELAKRGVDLGKGALESLWNYVKGLSPRQLDIHEAQHFQDTAEGKAKEYFTDSDARLRALVNAKGVDLPPAYNPADARENLPGQRRYGTEYFKARTDQVLKSIIQNSKDANIPVAQYAKELNQELVATHAPERNAVHGEGAAGMTNEQAAQIKADLKSRPYYDKLKADADSVRAVNQEALQRRLDTQLITQKTFDKLNELYPNHVPLNRILPEDAMKDVDSKLGGGPGMNVMSSGMRGAKGSDLPVQDVLGNVQANAIDAATRGAKNMADLQSVDFFRNNADKLNADGPAVKVITPKIVDKSKSGALIYADPEHPDRTLISRENGKPVYIEFHDKGLGQVMQGLNVAAPNGVLVRALGRMVNLMGQMQTTFSLGFKPNHFLRSAENLFFNISNETGQGTTAQNIKRMIPYQAQSLKAVADWMRGADTPLARQYDAYRKGGGIMGGFDSMSREEQVNSIQKQLTDLQRSKFDPRTYPATAVKAFHALDQFSDATSRFTAYRLALDAGKSPQEANAIARRVALDFDKNGTATKELNAIFKYSKVGLQSTGQLAKVLANPKSAALAAGTIGLVVTAQNNWNDAMDPNWRKDIPQGVQDSLLPIISKPREAGSSESPQYIPMPFAYAYTPIKVAMQEAYNMATGRQSDPAAAAKHVAGSAFLKVLNPFGGTFDAQHPAESVAQTLTPTALRPLAEAGLNRAWTGKSIHPDYNGAEPSQVYYPGTKNTLGGRASIGTSGVLAKAGLQVSPNTVGYVAGQYGAGPLSAIRSLTDVGAKVARGEPLTAQDIPGSHFLASTNPNFQRTRQDLAPEQAALQSDKTAQAIRTRQAEELWDKLKPLPQTQWQPIIAQEAKAGNAPVNDPLFINEMNRLAKNDKLDASARVLKGMDTDGRAKWLVQQYEAMKDNPAEWNAFAARNKELITPAVTKRANELVAQPTVPATK